MNCRQLPKITVGLVACLLLLVAGGCAGPKRFPPAGTEPRLPEEPLIRTPNLVGVGLAERKASLALVATGTSLLLDAQSGKRLARLEGASITVDCKRSGDRIAWQSGGQSGTATSLVLQPVDPGRRVAYGDDEYRGEFLVMPSPGAPGLTLVNNVELENYLRGVVPWEIGRHGRERLAALAAQAVAARTYVISHLDARSARGFDVYASVMDQVYRGSADEDPLCNEAIDQTAGLVLRDGGQEIEAYYSACCGGVSSRIEEVWARGAQPYLISHDDSRGGGEAFCAQYRYYHWREEWTIGRIEEILQKTLPEYVAHMSEPGRSSWAGPLFIPRRSGDTGTRPGKLLDLEITDRTSSGRVSSLSVRTEAGEYLVRGDRVRWVLVPGSGNPAILRSALFEVELGRRDGALTEVAARGRGYGHGIGLCQAGSLAMATKGHSYQEILAHYYPGARLHKVHPGSAAHRN
jgi:stage II sporulation protein D (peptidoglycan lytic transglycosylase)